MFNVNMKPLHPRLINFVNQSKREVQYKIVGR